MVIMVLKYPIKMANYSSREDIVTSLNDMSFIQAEYVSTGLGVGFIAISMDDEEVTADDILSIGAYIGQIETITLI
jgi:hypothetical protein